MKLIKAMATVAGLTGLSRIFGFIRDIMMAAILGAGPVADAFFVALKLPNFFRRVSAEGAFSVSFIPLYSEKLEQKGEEEANAFASSAFAVMLLILVPFTLIALWAMPWIIYGIAPGFQDDPERYTLAVELSRITFPYLLLMSLTALLGGILNAHGRYGPFAAAPVLFNLSLIAALLLSPALQSAGHALSYGVFAAGIAQLLWLFYSVSRAKIQLSFKKPAFDTDIKKLFKLMGPGVIGAGVTQINLFVDVIIASILPAGSISYLYYADRLNQLPLGMIGIALGTALLPMLSKAVAAHNTERANHLYNRAMELCFFFAIPAMFALFAMSFILIEVLFQRGAFSSDDAEMTALVLTSYAIGLPGYVAVKVFSTVFWSNQDTVTPVKISIIITVLNIIFSLILIQFLGVVGIALSTGLLGWVHFGLMYLQVRKKGGFFVDDVFKKRFRGILISSLVMFYVLGYGSQYIAAYLQGPVLLGTLVFMGMAVYGAGILALKVIGVNDLKNYVSKQKV